jgi:hypothetical protein
MIAALRGIVSGKAKSKGIVSGEAWRQKNEAKEKATRCGVRTRGLDIPISDDV